MTTNVGIVGFRGYSGMELERILTAHTGVTPWLLEHRADSTQDPQPIGHSGPQRIPCTAEAAREAGLQIVFLATPPEVSMELAAAFLPAGIRVVDLSGAFRLVTPENYKHWYKSDHTQPELLREAVYGLPEFNRAAVPQARLLSNPGCYPTAANLALRPLVQARVVDTARGIVCDAKSGVSGAGRKASLKTSFSEVTENFSAYSLLDHRHVPEVLMNSGLQDEDFSFTAQLIPIHRGILETIYFRAKGVTTSAELLDIYLNAYRNEPFVRLYPAGAVPDLRGVNRTNFCDIGVKLDSKTGRAVVVSCIDNLGKGAAGQAIQNMNLMLGFQETEGLL
ncbi:N-acetyl-gamma-glutamyl-phosphate reductase [Paludibaculum fermentans]|uniref:N-acetyl-gamma-glutamyl-phosphate reductase n=1 Tax=Paludibaculum fermentans TaxID=1473598 RepID=UPI003EBD1B2D